MQMSHPVMNFEITGKDPEALQRFYRDAFDWQVEPKLPWTMAFPVPDRSTGIVGVIGSTPDELDSYATFYIDVDDLDAALAKVEGLGGTAKMQPVDVPDGPCIALFADPEGHLIGLIDSSSRQPR
jgi:hypothetical protein